MKSVADRFALYLTLLLLLAFVPAGVLAGQARASMEVSVQVVRGDYSRAAAALIATAEIRGSASAAINPADECKAIGNKVIVDGVWARCNWDADSHAYLVTVLY
jgi:hypothetical protein